MVDEGQLLYTIDAREYRAQVATADANLASAEANLARARQDVERYEPLLAENAISQQVYDNAVAAAKEAEAQVRASRAAITEARLGVEYAEVRAPMTGRIGASQVFEGALITAGQTLLATISDDDPAWVDFSLSESELLDYMRRYGPTEPAADSVQRYVHLTLSDGTHYPHPGRISFTDRALDPTTGHLHPARRIPEPESSAGAGTLRPHPRHGREAPNGHRRSRSRGSAAARPVFRHGGRRRQRGGGASRDARAPRRQQVGRR